MKKILFIVVLVFPTLLFSQIFNPVTWEFSKKDLGIRIFIDDELVVDQWNSLRHWDSGISKRLLAEKFYDIRVDEWKSLLDENGILFDLKGLIPRELDPLRI